MLKLINIKKINLFIVITSCITFAFLNGITLEDYLKNNGIRLDWGNTVSFNNSGLTDINGISKLKVFDKKSKQLIPITQIKDLRLNLSQNPLESLPAEIGNLKNMTELDVWWNKLWIYCESRSVYIL